MQTDSISNAPTPRNQVKPFTGGDSDEDRPKLSGSPISRDDAAKDSDATLGDEYSALSEQLADTIARVADKIKTADSILVALSQDPSVDEISAALALTMMLDNIGKHATAIYSGNTPNTLEFLKPDETFEKNTDSLQDFIIAINKEKADHLSYKIEGDYVKVYITPYRTIISEKDLEFDRGDYNVDLVITIDVDSGEDIDGALSEYGRIMHDATAVNITNSAPGHFAELEWSNMDSASICEMVIALAEELDIKEFPQNIATALLTGIVSATDRFSNNLTTPETMQIASRLMSYGADQQLISSHIMANMNTPEAPQDATETPESVPETQELITNETPAEDPEAPIETAPQPEPIASEPMQAPTPQPEPITPEPIAPEPISPEPITPEPQPQPAPDQNLASMAAPDLPNPDFNILPPPPQIDYSMPAMPPQQASTAPMYIAPSPMPAPTPAPQPEPIASEPMQTPTPAPIPQPEPVQPEPVSAMPPVQPMAPAQPAAPIPPMGPMQSVEPTQPIAPAQPTPAPQPFQSAPIQPQPEPQPEPQVMQIPNPAPTPTFSSAPASSADPSSFRIPGM